MRVPLCGRFCSNEGGVAGYGNRMRAKYTAKWGLQLAEMVFQTRSGQSLILSCRIFFQLFQQNVFRIISNLFFLFLRKLTRKNRFAVRHSNVCGADLRKVCFQNISGTGDGKRNDRTAGLCCHLE
ncbi:DUF6783 domain-containing protein [Fusicatenibacter saccharivorans]|uniref:DUF6783 domain-containing protein n=1 Tax=Fusicatenibacter saccharivorans TaxID=1150298 RepID=UPI002FE6F30A